MVMIGNEQKNQMSSYCEPVSDTKLLGPATAPFLQQSPESEGTHYASQYEEVGYPDQAFQTNAGMQRLDRFPSSPTLP